MPLEVVGVRAVVQGTGRYVTDARRVNKATENIGRTAKTTEKRTVTMGESMRLSGTRMREMGTQAVFLGGALTALAAAPAFLAGRFETAFVKIETLVGESREELEKLLPAVLALSGETARSPQELADALFVVESGGLRGAEALATLDASARAAALGMGETGDIVRVTTQAILAFRSQNLTAARAVNVLVGTARAGNFETSQLAGAFGRVLPLAAELGIRFSDLGAFIAAYTRVGGNATQATTALAAVLTGLTRGGTAAKEAMESVGLSLSQLRTVAREQGLAQALFSILEAVEKGGAGAEERLATIIPNIRALRGVLATAGVQAEEFLRIQTELAGELDLLNEGFERLQEDSMFRFERALNDVKVGAVKFGATFLPIMADAVEIAVKAFSAFTALPEPIQRLVGTTALLGGAVIVLGGTFAILAGSILSVSGSIVPLILRLGALTAGLTGARIASIAFTATPLFLGLAAITITVIAISKAMNAFGSATRDAADAQRDLADAINSATLRSNEQLASQRDLAAASLANLEGRLAATKRERLRTEEERPITRVGIAKRFFAIRTLKDEEKELAVQIASQQDIIDVSTTALEIRENAIRSGSEAIEEQLEINRQEQSEIEGVIRTLEREERVRGDLSDVQSEALARNRDELRDLRIEEGKFEASIKIATDAEQAQTAALDTNTEATDANAEAKRKLAEAEREETTARRLAAEQVIRERGLAPAGPADQQLLEELVRIGDIDLEDILGPGVTPEGAREIIGLTEKLKRLRQAQLTGELDAIEQIEAEIAALVGASDDAVAGLTELQRTLQAFGDRRQREQVAGLIRELLGIEGPGLGDVRAAQSELDAVFASIAPIIADRLGVIPELFRELMEEIITGVEDAALDQVQRGRDLGGLLGILIARRLAEAPAGLGPGAGLIAAPGTGGLGVGEGSEFSGVTVEEMNINVGGGNNSPGETAAAFEEGLRATFAEQPS